MTNEYYDGGQFGGDDDDDEEQVMCVCCCCIIGDEVGYGDDWGEGPMCDRCAPPAL